MDFWCVTWDRSYLRAKVHVNGFVSEESSRGGGKVIFN